MKVSDLLIGGLLFSLVIVIVFGFINPEDDNSIYSPNILNVTHDSNTSMIISNITSVANTNTKTIDEVQGDLDEFTQNRSSSVIPTEANLILDSIKVIINIPKAYKSATNAARMTGEQFAVPKEFLNWMVSSIVIIVSIILITVFLRNKLQT